MNNKYSRIKNHQLITENWRKYMNEGSGNQEKIAAALEEYWKTFTDYLDLAQISLGLPDGALGSCTTDTLDPYIEALAAKLRETAE